MADNWRVIPGSGVRLAEHDPDNTGPFQNKDDARAAMDADLERLRDLQELLYVDGRYAVLMVLQGMDTAGKDGTIKHLSSGISLLSGEVSNFKTPSQTELEHDFLWRIHQRVPEKGRIGIFNRSHYEDVLIVRVHELVPPEVWGGRYEHINAFEKLLHDGNTVIVKCFLHIDAGEQKERLQARLDNPAKLWKFNLGDLKERARWHDYQRAYEDALSRCSTEHAPWHIIPANRKWFRNYAVTRLLLETLESLDLRLPPATVDPRNITIT
jgi:PPK2 family polyphosphate:nucleotide phosphotransferase